jgi:hypothetical protein
LGFATGFANNPVPSGIADRPNLYKGMVLTPKTIWITNPITNSHPIANKILVLDMYATIIPTIDVTTRSRIANIPNNLLGNAFPGPTYKGVGCLGITDNIKHTATKFTINSVVIRFILVLY